MLEIEKLTKTFGTQTVISDISMTLVSGKIYGISREKWFWKNNA